MAASEFPLDLDQNRRHPFRPHPTHIRAEAEARAYELPVLAQDAPRSFTAYTAVDAMIRADTTSGTRMTPAAARHRELPGPTHRLHE